VRARRVEREVEVAADLLDRRKREARVRVRALEQPADADLSRGCKGALGPERPAVDQVDLLARVA
jgi:hypothetical protein